eukprot:TRINITY_DN22943_c0_g1_i3.p1 TRINITY_DN22943_c0_g1~~TRINITY_DN22943_c0_g1_i3.p1  ORF type:complete len:170 (-),score=17.37 TRINITY_DN22943_c0_g1_i3:158-667(-)
MALRTAAAAVALTRCPMQSARVLSLERIAGSVSVVQKRTMKSYVRKPWLSEQTTKTLTGSGHNVSENNGLLEYSEYVVDEQSAANADRYHNTQNTLGTIEQPVGVIGPVQVTGEHANRKYFVHMASQEGASVSSYDRGAQAIHAAGGCTVRVGRPSTLRAPVYRNLPNK